MAAVNKSRGGQTFVAKQVEDELKKFKAAISNFRQDDNLNFQEEGKQFIINHQWTKQKKLGSGGQAVVHLMEGTKKTTKKGLFGWPFKRNQNRETNITTKVVCARKKTYQTMNPSLLEGFIVEREFLTLVDHPNIVRYYHYELEKTDSIRIYMELMNVSHFYFTICVWSIKCFLDITWGLHN